MTQFIKNNLREAQNVLNHFLESEKNIQMMETAIELMIKSFKNKGRVYSCGNGGSLSDAMHFAEELTGRFRDNRAPLAALSFTDPGHMSCVANDYGYEFIFSRMVESFAQPNDTLLVISTSGNSPNIINACEAAKVKGVKIVGLLGKDGGKVKNMVDVPIIVPSQNTGRIQEVHIKIIHSFIEGIERSLFPESYKE